MHETRKSATRRARDPVFQSRYFCGHGIDIGAGDDSLGVYAHMFPKILSVRAWDRQDGNAQHMAGIPDGSLDFVHSSHCLEHLDDPRDALRNWLRILAPGGFLVISVPDEDLYEGGQWPSLMNAEHLWSFTINRSDKRHCRSINVTDLIDEFSDQVECELVRQVRDFYRDESGLGDQTLGPAECAIEWVWRKREVGESRSAHDLLVEGYAAESTGDDARAERLYRRALRVSSDNFEGYNLLAHFLNRFGRAVEAAQLWDQGVAKLSDPGQALVYQALQQLSMGNFDRGFSIREAIVPDNIRTPVSPPSAYPRWQGECLHERSIVIWDEFGLGDQIQFARFARVFKENLGASTVSIVCLPSLVRLFESLPGVDRVCSRDEAAGLPDHDYWVFGHSIGRHYSLDLQGIPRDIPYLFSKRAAGELSNETGEIENKREAGLSVGIVWKGNPTHENDRYRSLPGLLTLMPLFELHDIRWVSLQVGDTRGELQVAISNGVAIEDGTVSVADFADTALVVDRLDLVITVDTSVAHLAGALGKPVWVLLPTAVDWRWGLHGKTSAWYPHARLFRQSRLGHWEPVIAEVRSELERYRRYAKQQRAK